MAKEKTFLGIGWKFPPTFDKETTTIQMVSDDQDIKESLHILLSTRPGERTMLPDYGCDMNFLVFEAIDSTVLNKARKNIEKAILFFEPRITIGEIDFNTEQFDQGVLLVNLTFTIKKTNTRSNMVYPFYILEGTEVRYSTETE